MKRTGGEQDTGQEASRPYPRSLAEAMGVPEHSFAARKDCALGGGSISKTAQVVAPGMMVMSVVLFMGAVSGAHLNPAVSLAFALRRDFSRRRVRGYVGAQLAGAALAMELLVLLWANTGRRGSRYPVRV